MDDVKNTQQHYHMSHKEIAEALSIKESTVKSTLERAMRKIRTRYGIEFTPTRGINAAKK